MPGQALLVIILLTFLGAQVSGVPLLVKAAYALVILILISYAWTWLNLRRLTAKVQPGADRCQVGQFFEEEVTLSNQGVWPKVSLEVAGGLDLPGQRDGKVVSLMPGGSLTWQSRTKCQLRGLYRVGMVTVRSGDPWGLFLGSLRLGRLQSLLVYPATMDLPHFILPTLPESRGEGHRSGRTVEAPPLVSGLRDYVPGDAFSRIHWPTTARTGKLMVKDFKLHPSGEVWVILDLQGAAQAGSGSESTEEYAMTIASSLARHHLEANYSVGLLAQGNQRLALNPQRGRHYLWRILESLALIRAQGRLPLGQLLAQEAGNFAPHSSLLVITPGGSGLEAALLHHVLPRGSRVTVVVLDSISFGGKDGSLTLAQRLGAAGVETYLVRRGDYLSQALDSRLTGPAKLKIEAQV